MNDIAIATTEKTNSGVKATFLFFIKIIINEAKAHATAPAKKIE